MNKNNNHIVEKGHTRLMVFSILVVILFLLFIGTFFRYNENPDYPLVFMSADNKLMFITKSSNNEKDINALEDFKIVYAKNEIGYFLYTDDNNLYLRYTVDSNKENILLSTDASDFGFSDDDKNVYYIESNNDLHVYNIKTASNTLIDNNVSKCIDIVTDYVIYEKDGNLTLKNYSTGAREVISKSYEDVIISKDNKYMLYSVLNGQSYNYFIYTFSNYSNDKVLSNVYELLSYNDSFTKFIYTVKNNDSVSIYNDIKDTSFESDSLFVKYSEDDLNNGKVSKEEYDNNINESILVDERNKMREYARNYNINGYDVYYQSKETSTLLESGVTKVYLDDISERKIIYTKSTWNGTLDITTFSTLQEFKEALEDACKNGLYYKYYTNKGNLISDNVNSDIHVSYLSGDGIYYIEDNNLYYSKVSSRVASTKVLVDENVSSIKLIQDFSLGLVYLTNDNNNNSLKYVKNGKYKVINEYVYSDYIKVADHGKSIYYIKDYTSSSGNLMLFNGIRNSVIARDVHSFMYINDGLMYITKNYNENTKTSDMYQLDEGKTTIIYEGILDWYSPLEEEE